MKRNKRVLSFSLIIIIIIAILIIFFSDKNIINNVKADKSYEKIKMEVAEEDNEKDVKTNPKEWDVIKELQEKNPDVVGWIDIDGTEIQYPILQGEDNDYYLKRTYEKVESDKGSIFLDCLNKESFDEVNTVIYGHNMMDGSMFAGLCSFRDKEFLEKNKYITIYLPNKVLKYEIFSVYATEADYDYRTKFFDNEEDINNFINRITCKTEVNTGIVPTNKDRIITLSTCIYDFDDARLAVHAILISED